jgi:mannose-1-phosphate guanylyltransferase
MLEAILLVGGQGTRLRPLTLSAPKPMLPVAGVPCTTHQIARAREAGVGHVVLGTSYQAEVFRSAYGDGAELGIQLTYAHEHTPLGTGGALRNVTDHLTSAPDDPVLVFNGDVLSGFDIAALVQHWRDAQADVALYLTRVEDPRPFGLVPTDADHRVLAFLEKPSTPEEIVTDQINAGCYVFRRRLLDEIPAGRPVSVERETFPGLLQSGAKVIGHVDTSYWLDLGTPLAFVRGSADLVRGIAPSPAVVGTKGEALIQSGSTVADDAHVGGGSAIGRNCVIHSGATVMGSVIMDGAVIGAGAVVRDSVVGNGSVIGPRTYVHETVVGDGCDIGPDNEFTSGARIWPGTTLAPMSVRFSSEPA